MKSRLLLALALGIAAFAGAAGCSSPCTDLGDRICQCEAEGQVRTNCKTNVKARIQAASPSGDQTSYCSTLLGTCPDANADVNTCAWILNTCEGKVACGLALPQPGSGSSGCNDVTPAADAAPL